MTSIEDRYIALLLQEAVYDQRYVFYRDIIEIPVLPDAIKDFEVMKFILKIYQALRDVNQQLIEYEKTGALQFNTHSPAVMKEKQKALQDEMDAVKLTHKKFVEVVELYQQSLHVASLKTEVNKIRRELSWREEELTSAIESIPKKKDQVGHLHNEKRRKYEEYASECEKLGCVPIPEEKLDASPAPTETN